MFSSFSSMNLLRMFFYVSYTNKKRIIIRGTNNNKQKQIGRKRDVCASVLPFTKLFIVLVIQTNQVVRQ